MLSAARWTTISASSFPWERDALDFIRQNLPDQDPYRAWSNFEFIADDGTIYEVDQLVLSPAGLFLVEIKSRPGVVTGDVHTWVWKDVEREYVYDNPLILANQKAKKLGSLLRHQRALSKIWSPYVEPLIFCSAPGVKIRLEGPAKIRVHGRDREGVAASEESRGIIAVLTNVSAANAPGARRIDSLTGRAIARAMEQAGIRPSNKARRVGDYELDALLGEGPAYQDYEATHVALKSVRRRVRLYPVPVGASADTRETIRRAAQREFQILEGVQHPGVLRALEYKDHERGAALIFDHNPEALRLDQYLQQRGPHLGLNDRLMLVRQIAEAVQYAHQKKLVHRALSPQSILVTGVDTLLPRIQILNWQTGYREAGSAPVQSARQVTGTSHLDALVEGAATVYMAPESIAGGAAIGEHLDVFSLGSIAYFIFSGKAPASTSLELAEKLREQKGLRLSAVLDGAGNEIDELIHFSTHPEVSSRLDSVTDFVEWLGRVEEELTRPQEEVVVDPLEARAGDRLQHGFTVRARLGRGSTAAALLVERNDKQQVLKVASEPDHNDRLRGEGEVLHKLRHQHIVELDEVLEFSGRVGLLMERAGSQTLAQRLTKEGPLRLELLQRFGEDLLTTVDWLEQQGIPHRDIKPDNIGIAPLGRGDKLHLVLFDFSLARTSPDVITAGTAPYLDPFLKLRKPSRWDLHAERFAAAVTLYEMTTGKPPVWGDGRSDPSLIEDEVALDVGLFDPNLRDEMADFFRQAFARDISQRFDHAENMLRAWRRIFEQAQQPATLTDLGDPERLRQMLGQATLDTPLAQLGLGTRALNALDRTRVHTVQDLLRISSQQVYVMPGVGSQTRSEIVEAIRILATRFAPEERLPEHVGRPRDRADTGAMSVDLLLRRLVPKDVAGENVEGRVLRAWLGLAEEPGSCWPSQAGVATTMGVARGRVGEVVVKARGRWMKDDAIGRLRSDIAGILEANGAVMSARELAQALVLKRGTVQDEPHRTRCALAVARAAVETEQAVVEPRFHERREGAKVLIATREAMVDYALGLGTIADGLAAMDPLPAPARVLTELQKLDIPTDIVISTTRLVMLAAAASDTAAVSSRLEIYPRGMDAGRAIYFALGALVGPEALTPAQIEARVRGRYPEAAPLPARPALDALLLQAGWEVDWHAGAGVYRSRTTATLVTSDTSYAPRFATTSAAPREVTPEVADARQFEARLEHAIAHGAFLALKVQPRLLLRAERELAARFAVERRSIEKLLLDSMREEARKAGAHWDVVVRADASLHDSRDWQNLLLLVRRALPAVEQKLLDTDQTLLLVYPGPLARYDQLDLLDRLRNHVGKPGAPRGAWVLVPCDDAHAAPVLDGKPIPVITRGEWADVPEPWVLNAHRGHA
jgi:serine/threonine protein kinase